MACAAYLWGLNYRRIPGSTLYGCIHDANNTARFLRAQFPALASSTTVYTDDVNTAQTTRAGWLATLRQIARDSANKAFIYIHVSGHGSSQVDRSGDELDRRDELLVPSDYTTAGFIRDDDLNAIFAQFAPSCKVLCCFDTCHSGTVLDLKYSWRADRTRSVIENRQAAVRANVVAISGCLDAGTSSDGGVAVPGMPAGVMGAFTSCWLRVLQTTPNLQTADAFAVVDRVRAMLRSAGYPQYPVLTASYDLSRQATLWPTALFPSPRRDVRKTPSKTAAKRNAIAMAPMFRARTRGIRR